ncbi:MAG: DUF6498-containing protein [Burkholderiaceae bacterium]|nr:DUF6498-containing protein [Burkholderiaceae bacterium]
MASAPSGEPAQSGPGLQRAVAVASALVATLGVLHFGWPVFVVMLLYWLENVLIGLANVLRILVTGTRPGSGGMPSHLFLAAFFTLHYGIFAAAHGMFVLVLFGPDGAIDVAVEKPATALTLLGDALADPWLALACAVLAASVAIDTLRWLRGSRHVAASKSDAQALMAEPYGRVAVLHVTLIFGAALTAMLGAPAAAAVLLVALKLGHDLMRLRRSAARGAPPSTSARASN